MCLTFRHHASYIYRTDVPLLHRVHFLYIYSTNIFNDFCLDFLSPSLFIPPQNVVCFLMLPFLVHKILTFYINGVLNCKCPAPGTMHPIYRTDVPLLHRVRFLYIQSTNIFNIFFRLSLAIFVYSSTKCRVFPNVTLLGS